MRPGTLVAATCALALSAPVAARAEPGRTVIDSGYGSLTVGAILQGAFDARFDGSGLDRNGDGTADDRDDVFLDDHYDFSLRSARVLLGGSLLGPNLTYAFEGDASLPMFVLDARLGYTVPEGEDVSTTFLVGRFLPSFTLMLPRPVSRLDAIDYPLYLFAPQGGNRQPFAPSNSLGRQVGLVIEQRVLGFLRVDLGVFNGYQRVDGEPNGAATWTDDNDWKDFLVRAAAKPTDDLVLAVDFWAGYPASLTAPAAPPAGYVPRAFATSETDPSSEHDSAYLLVLEADVGVVEGLTVEGEVAWSRQTTRTMDDLAAPATRSESTADGIGAWAHVGYTFEDLAHSGVDLDAFARFEYFDPDLDAGNDGRMRLTLGPQLFLEGVHSQIRLNYVLDLLDDPAAAWGDVRHEIRLQATVEI